MSGAPLVQGDPDGLALIAALPALLPEGAAPAALVTVVDTRGSAPRGAGARMLVREGRLLAGTVGGGHLEQRATALGSERVAADPDFAPERHTWALGPALAQCCGGQVSVRIEPVDTGRAAALAAALDEARRGAGVLHTGEGAHALAERLTPPWTVVIFGAGHVARALATALSVQPWRVVVVDARPDWADPAAFPAGAEVRCAPPPEVLQGWGWLAPEPADAQPAGRGAPEAARTACLVMTHDHDLDRALVFALLRARPTLAFVGLIGSKTKIATTRRRLTDLGLAEADLARLVAPIGLRPAPDAPPIGGKRPGEIALSVAAQLLVETRALDARDDAGARDAGDVRDAVEARDAP